jgi:hypothetical protein
MSQAEHRKPCESRGSRTVLGARGGEIPSRDSPVASSAALQRHVRSLSTSRHRGVIVSVPPQPRHALFSGKPRSTSGSLAMLAAMRPGRRRSPGALTCAKLRALCAGGCLRTNHLFAQSAIAKLGPAADSGAFFVATVCPSRPQALALAGYCRYSQSVRPSQ